MKRVTGTAVGWLFALLTATACGAASAAEDQPPLPPHALLRIGAGGMRMSSFLMGFAFSPDGTLIALADANARDPRVALFEIRTGRRVKQLETPRGRMGSVQCVAFSPDGTRLLWGELGGHVALWDVPGARLLFREKVSPWQIHDVAFSPDGRLFATAGDDCIQLRRTDKPAELVRTLAAPADAEPKKGAVAKGGAMKGAARAPAPPGAAFQEGFSCLAFTPDGKRLVGGTPTKATLYLWQIDDGRLLRTISGTHGQSTARAFNPTLNCVTVTPDGRRIMTVGQSTKLIEQTKLKYGSKNVTMSEVRFWDIETGKRLADYRGDEDYGFGFGALSPDGRRIAVADFSRLRILDAATGQPERTIELPGCWGRPPAFSPDGSLVAQPIQNTIGLFEVATGRRLNHDDSRPEGQFDSAAWSPNGAQLITGHGDGFVRIWDAATGKLIRHRLLAPVIDRSGWNAGPAFVAFSDDGRHVIVAGRRDDPVHYRNGIVATYHAATGLLRREANPHEVRWAALAPDARTIVVATSPGGAWDDAHFIAIDVRSGETLWTNPPEEQRAGFVQIAAIQFSPDSSMLHAALRDGEVIRFDARTGKEKDRFLADWRTAEQKKAGKPSRPDIWSASFSADGRTLVSAQAEWIYIWDVATGKRRRSIPYPHQHSCNLTLAPDGRTLATSDLYYIGDLGEDTIRLYDIETGKPITTFKPDERASVLVFSPDSQRLFTGFHGGSGIIWDVHRGQGATGSKEWLPQASEEHQRAVGSQDHRWPPRPSPLDPSTDHAGRNTLKRHTHSRRHLPSLPVLFKHVGRLRNLEVLKLDLPNRGDPTHAEYEHLRGLTQLRELQLIHCRMTGDDLALLAGMTRLKKLRVLELKNTDLSALANLHQLQDLFLGSTPLTDKDVEMVAGLVQLGKLRISVREVRKATLAKLNNLPALCDAIVRNTGVSDD